MDKLKNMLAESSHISNLKSFLIDGYNLDLVIERPVHTIVFWILRHVYLGLVTLAGAVASWIYWGDPDIDPVMIGNVYIGFGIPKETFLTATIASVIIMNGVQYLTSYYASRRDSSLMCLLGFVQAIIEEGRVPRRGINPRVARSVRKQVSKYVGAARLLLKSTLINVLTFCFPILSFYLLSSDNFTGWKLIPTLFWSFQFSSWSSLLCTVTLSGLLVTMVTSRYFKLSVELMEDEVAQLRIEPIDPDQELELEQRKKLLLFRHLNQLMYLLHFVRTINPGIRIIIGSCVLWMCVGAQFCTHCAFFVTLPSQLFWYLFIYFVIFFCSLLSVPLLLVAQFSRKIERHSRIMFKLSNEVNLDCKIKNRINWILDGMRYHTSFDCFKFFPDIDYMFIGKVSREL